MLGVVVGRWRDGVTMLADLWVAVGLLRLGFDPTYRRILAATGVVLVRHLVLPALLRQNAWAVRPERRPTR